MPGMDGLEAIRSLVAPDPRFKIIAVSGSNPQWVEEYLKDAATFETKRVLRKPVTLKQLLAAVADVLAM
jgi:CheY-like chemotaxis protein